MHVCLYVMYVCMYVCLYVYMYVCMYICMYVCRAGFKKQKVIRNFCEIATHFGKVIRSCESIFAKYSDFASYA